MKITGAALAIVLMSGTLACAQSSGGSSGGSSGSSGSTSSSSGSTSSSGNTSGSPPSSTNSGVINPVLPRSPNPQTTPAPSDSTTVGRSPGTNPANPQDLTNRRNPQDLTL